MSLYVSNRWHSNACLLLIRIRNPLDQNCLIDPACYILFADSIYHLSFASVLPKLIANLNAMKEKYLKAPHPVSLNLYSGTN